MSAERAAERILREMLKSSEAALVALKLAQDLTGGVAACAEGDVVPLMEASNSHAREYLAAIREECAAGVASFSNAQIGHMVSRFLSWRLPEKFTPDCGISFKADFNENTPYPAKHQPTGTNLFDYQQAEEMIRHIIEGLPCAAEWVSVAERLPEEYARVLISHTRGIVEEAMYIGNCEWELSRTAPQDELIRLDQEVTHWRALPTPPVEEPSRG